MPTMILLPEADADAVRGRGATGAALDPVALADGRYVLPAVVLDDPAHTAHHARLAALPQAEGDTLPWVPPEE